MDSPQYTWYITRTRNRHYGFKPYYKWIVLNTKDTHVDWSVTDIKF